MYRMPTGAGPVEVGASLKGMYRGPPILLEWIGCVPSLADTGRIAPGSKLLLVVVWICGVVAS